MKSIRHCLFLLAIIGVMVIVMNVVSDESDAVEQYSGKINFNPDEVEVYYGEWIEPMAPIDKLGFDIFVQLKTGYENVTINGNPYNISTSEVVATAALRDAGIVIETEKIQYTLIYQGISNNSSQPLIPAFEIGSDISIMMPIMTRNGYDMVNWNTSENGDGESIDPGNYHIDAEFIERIFSSGTIVDLYPVWSAKTYFVTLETERGAITDNKWSGSDGRFSTDFTIESEEFLLPSPESDDRFHDFVCWQDQNGVTVTKVENGTYGNIQLSAVWKNHDYSVSFTVNGRTYNGTYTIDDSIPDPDSEAGFRFVGWYYEDQDGNETEFTQMSQMYEGMTVYAVFEPIKEDPVLMASIAAALILFFSGAMFFAFTRK